MKINGIDREIKPRANLTGANLREANLYDADLYDADLHGASLTEANLTGAIMPDGRTWEAYSEDSMAGLCDTQEVRDKAVAAWGKHSWTDCPMHAALGIDSPDQAGAGKALLVSCWVALYDANLLDKPV